MINFSKKIVIGLMALMAVSSQLVYAQDNTVGKGVSLGRCLQGGGLEYKLFLNASIYNDDLKEGIIEPWKDILSRNACHSADVMKLVKQQDSLRKKIRDSFLTCKTDNLPKLKKSFSELTAEIYYVRHVAVGGVILSLPFDLLESRPFEGAFLTDSNQLYTEMYNKYVKEDFLEASEFDALFEKLEEKYKDRKATYVSECKNNSWQDVADKWKEFVDTLGGIEPAFTELEEGLEKRAQEVAKEAETLKIVELIKEDGSVLDYLGSFATITINNTSPKKAFEEIGGELFENLPLSEDGQSVAPSTGEFLESLATAEQKYDLEQTREKIKGNFTTLYYNASDESVDLFLDSLDGRDTVSKKDDGLIETLDSTFPELAKIVKGIDSINDRQCS